MTVEDGYARIAVCGFLGVYFWMLLFLETLSGVHEYEGKSLRIQMMCVCSGDNSDVSLFLRCQCSG